MKISANGTADPGLRHAEAVFALSDGERDCPPESLEIELGQQFPTEEEYDNMLSRKLARRRETVKPVPGLDGIAAMLRAFLRAQFDDGAQCRNLRWLSGGGSKIQVAFSLTTTEPFRSKHEHELVIRLEPTESLNATSRRREGQILQAMTGTVPVPEVYWVDETGDWFGEPALIYTFVRGVTKPSGTKSHVGGVGGQYADDVRRSLATQFIEDLAKIHTFDIGSCAAPLDAFTVPPLGTVDSALWQVHRAQRIWEEDRSEELPYLDVAANWLHRNLPTLDRISVVHGDYRTGNFLFDETTNRVVAWLDWERGYLGDRHRDLAWITLPQWGKRDPATGELLVSGLVPLTEFYERYTAVSGLAVDPEKLRFYTILNYYQLMVSTLGTAQRVARLGRSHQDILLCWIEGLAHSFAEDLRAALLSDKGSNNG